MMLVPRRNRFDLLDDFFDDGFFEKREKDLMRTDIKEKKDKYIVEIDLPGFDKKNINVSLENGYLKINAFSENSNESNEEKFLRQERFYGECSRSFYVGDELKEEDIKAEFKDGILKVELPKKEKDIEEKAVKQIEIK